MGAKHISFYFVRPLIYSNHLYAPMASLGALIHPVEGVRDVIAVDELFDCIPAINRLKESSYFKIRNNMNS